MGVNVSVCGICQHVERTRIELMLAGGASRRAVAEKYGLAATSVRRHWTKHVSPERRAQLVMGPVQRAALAARVAEESESVLDHLKVVRAGLYALFDAAVEAGDRNGGAILAGRLIVCLEKIGHITGQLAQSPLLVNNTQVNVFASDPAFALFQADLIRVLSRFPDARAAVLAEFERLDRVDTPTVPALEHQSAEDTHSA